MIGMAPKRFGFWMLFLWIQEAVVGEDCGNITGVLGRDVDLRCCYTRELESPPFRTQWQVKGNDDCVVAAHLPDQKPAPVCERFKNRISGFIQNRLQPRLLNISKEDEGIYQCILQRKKENGYDVFFQGTIRLSVSDVYIQPVITGPIQSGPNMTFTCSSSSGSPETRVYWRNQTDNSSLNSNDTIKQHNGTFIVSSIVTIQAASNIALECIIENNQLNQRFSAIYVWTTPITPTPFKSDNDKGVIAVSSLAAIVIIMAVPLLIWCKRKQSSRTLI